MIQPTNLLFKKHFENESFVIKLSIARERLHVGNVNDRTDYYKVC